MTRRCKWCGRFVRSDQRLTAWRVPVGRGSRQNPRSRWNYWARLLCPDCAANIDSGVWERITVATVIARRGLSAVGSTQ